MSGSTVKETGDFKAFVAQHKDGVYNKINEYMPTDLPEGFGPILRCYVDRKGKYARPAYTILWNLLYGGNVNDSLLPAAAQQLSEDYFLMHDDWMDGNSVRRGEKAAHLIYGPEYTIDAGDTLHAILWRIAGDAKSSLKEKRGKMYMDKFYDIMLTTHVGQYLDLRLTREIKDITKFTMDDYFRSIHGKSAYYSVYGPMQCGAIIAGADQKVVDGIKGYGTLAGLAFQMKDDILDCVSSEAELGKSIGTDVKESVKTIILWHAAHNADSATLAKMKEIYQKPRESKTAAEIKFVLKKFNDLGSIEFAQKEAERFSAESLELFEKETKSIPENTIKAIARGSISHTTKRQK
jgi:geranylgeranyl pyrophosphate synthase